MEALIDYFYFPSNAVISLVTQMNDGRIIEVGLVGSDGMTGLAALFGQRVSAERAIVQIPNSGARVKAAVILDEFKRGGEVHDAFLKYANSSCARSRRQRPATLHIPWKNYSPAGC